MANSAALIAMWRSISPLAVSEMIAWTIWVGEARNSGLAMTRRLMSSHSASPPSTDKVPARYLSRAPAHMSVGDLSDAREEQTLDREARRDIAQGSQRVDQLADLGLGNFSGRLEVFPGDQEVVGL